MGETVKSAPTGSIPHWSEVYSMGHESLAPHVAYVQTPRAVQQQPQWGGPKVGVQRLTATGWRRGAVRLHEAGQRCWPQQQLEKRDERGQEDRSQAPLYRDHVLPLHHSPSREP